MQHLYGTGAGPTFNHLDHNMAAVMTDAGAGTACVGGDPEAYLTMKDTFDLSYAGLSALP